VTDAGTPAAGAGPDRGTDLRLSVPPLRPAERGPELGRAGSAAGDGPGVAASIHHPVAQRAPGSAIPVLLLPGSRGDHAAPHLVALATLLAAHGHPVVRSALLEGAPGSGVVPRAERAVERMRAVLVAARAALASSGDAAFARCDWVVGGASYGGRVASLAVAASGGRDLGVSGLLALAYPLHPPGRPDRPRTAHWSRIDVPTLLIGGDADPFMTLELLEAAQATLLGGLTSIVVAGAAHDLSVSARRAPDGRRRSPADVIDEHGSAVLGWMHGLAQ
jgi:uncharacterized protein